MLGFLEEPQEIRTPSYLHKQKTLGSSAGQLDPYHWACSPGAGWGALEGCTACLGIWYYQAQRAPSPGASVLFTYLGHTYTVPSDREPGL